jgi:hypothetical protein
VIDPDPVALSVDNKAAASGNNRFPRAMLSFGLSLRSYMLDVVVISPESRPID